MIPEPPAPHSQASNILTKHRNLIGLLIISFSLLAIWAFAVPIYEAPDEPLHWRYANYVHDNWKLPLYTQAFQEANSPPLYYALVAPFATDTTEPVPIINNSYQSPEPPRWFDGTSRDLRRYWPIRIPRLVSSVLSVITVLFCYLAGLTATGEPSTGLLVGGLVAFLPQFTFRGMNVSNDPLVTMACAAATYLIVRIIRRGFTWRWGILSAVTIAVAFLSKTNAIFLPVPFGLALLGERGTWRLRFTRLSILGISLVLVAPWLIRNQILYGDPLANRAMFYVVADLVHVKSITSPYFYTVFPIYLLQSFVGVFGWMNLPLPPLLYTLFAFLAVAAFAGYVWRGIQHRIDWHLTLILLMFPLLSLAVTVYINLSFSQPQGRYLFPALPAIALLLGRGLEAHPVWSKQATFLLLGALLVINLYIIRFVVIPAYWY